MLEYKNGAYLVLPGMISLIISDKKILSLIEGLATLKLVDMKVSVRLFTCQPSNPRVRRHQYINL